MIDGNKLEEIKKANWEITNDCYERACLLVGYKVSDIKVAYLQDWISKEEFDSKLEALDEKYRWLLCQLPTITLEQMVELWEGGHQQRAQKTMQTVTTELFERQLVEELKEDEEGRHT